jgi:D-xylose transport system substrate-binding protein
MEGIPVSGQDGDHAALNRVALGTQTVSVWKDARELGKGAGEIAVKLASGAMMSDIAGTVTFETPGGNSMNAMFLAPVPVTADNLSIVVDAGWIPLESLCQGVTGGPAPCN